jgi:predicted GH43/DUF377 family glycosyl hydrolase
MLKVKKEGILLEKTELEFENDSVLNPACYQQGRKVHMFYRAVKKGNYSTIGYCLLDGPLKVLKRLKKPVLFPEHKFESESIEDPRIVKIKDTYYLTYTAYNRYNACGALATSKDLKKFRKHGFISPQYNYKIFQNIARKNKNLSPVYFKYNEFSNVPRSRIKKQTIWDKDVVFFPKKINNKLFFLHRIRPEIQHVSVKSLKELTEKFWEKYTSQLNDYIFMSGKYKHESCYIGAGCPPVKTKDGWLFIYHGVSDGRKGFVYHACAALFDLKNVTKEIGRLSKPLISPTEKWEKKGTVSNIVFPTGTSIFNKRLYIYYGAADSHIAVASVNLNELLKELKKKSNRKD